MPFLCKLLLDEYVYKDHEAWIEVERLGDGIPYDMYNLYDAIQWAKDYLKIGTNYYNIDYHKFIVFCAGEIKKGNYTF
jgi:hypothetical protein